MQLSSFKNKNILLQTIVTILISGLAIQSNAQTQLSVCTSRGITEEDCLNVVSTAVPLLRATSDARSGAMGDVGLALSPDANSLFWNGAKMAFNEDPAGLSASFSPWLRQLGITDIYLSNLSGYYKPDDLQAIGVSLRYFSFGEITFTDFTGFEIQKYRPNEFYLDFGYARKLSDQLSTGLTLKYIHSDLAKGTVSGGSNIKVGKAVAADVSFYYTNDISIAGTDATLNLGLAATNIGNKVSYSDDDIEKDFLPANLGIGAALDFDFDQFNKFTFAYDLNKLMAPTPNAEGDHMELDAVSGIFSSFADAPLGVELNEIMHSIGMEYWYNDVFAIRAGYFIFGLNLSYLAPTTGQHHPLARTIRFTLAFDFDDLSI